MLRLRAELVRRDDEHGVGLRIRYVDHAKASSAPGTARRNPGPVASGTILDRTPQHVEGYPLLDAVTPDVRGVRLGIDVESNDHQELVRPTGTRPGAARATESTAHAGPERPSEAAARRPTSRDPRAGRRSRTIGSAGTRRVVLRRWDDQRISWAGVVRRSGRRRCAPGTAVAPCWADRVTRESAIRRRGGNPCAPRWSLHAFAALALRGARLAAPPGRPGPPAGSRRRRSHGARPPRRSRAAPGLPG